MNEITDEGYLPLTNINAINRSQSFGKRLADVLRRDKLIYTVIIFYSLMVAAVGTLVDRFDSISLFFYPEVASLAVITASVVFLVYYLIMLIVRRHPHPLSDIHFRLVGLIKAPENIISFVMMCFMTTMFISAFTSAKGLIQHVIPFRYDFIYANLDRILHLGVNPWEITHWLIPTASGTAFIIFFYHLWFFIYWGVVLFFILRLKDYVLRQHYLLAHLLCWMIIGTLFATVMSSAGPCFYGFVETGPDPFASLMALLNEQNEQLIAGGGWIKVWPLKLQDALWNRHIDAEISIGGGISAMPSMHVSIAVLMALGIQKINWKLGAFFWLNALVIQIGSVHLGWHYAIDGYVAAILTVIIWKISGRLVERFSPNNGSSA